MKARTLGKSLLALPIVFRHKVSSRDCPSASCSLQISLSEYCYARYFYSLIKAFAISGYSIRIDAPLSVIYSLSRAGYSEMIFSEGLASVGRFDQPSVTLGSNGKHIEPYDFIPPNSENVFDVPMLQHPLMYSKGYWNQPVIGKQAHSAIFIGNGSDSSYSRSENQDLFRVINRQNLLQLLRRHRRSRQISSAADLHGPSPGEIVIADSKLSGVPMCAFRSTLGSFRFFICAPGAFMPLCHNLVEAISVGCIPILQRNYALLVPGIIDGENSIVFNDEQDFDESLERAFSLSSISAKNMSDQVREFYRSNLTPMSVVGRIIDDATKVVRVLAGERSLAQFRKARSA